MKIDKLWNGLKRIANGEMMYTRYIEMPVLYPMGPLTFAIACRYCANRNSDLCLPCKWEKRSGFELKREPKKEANNEN